MDCCPVDRERILNRETPESEIGRPFPVRTDEDVVFDSMDFCDSDGDVSDIHVVGWWETARLACIHSHVAHVVECRTGDSCVTRGPELMPRQVGSTEMGWFCDLAG